MKQKTKLFTGLCLSAALCVGFGVANWTKAAAEESFPTSWTINENAVDLTVTNVAEGGVGTITYYTVPEGDTSEYGIYNSVTIPVSDHDVANGYVSIKYDADFDVLGSNITLYANYAAGTDDQGNDYEAGYVLFGWFENWNVTTGKTVDGYTYKTIFFGNYTESKTVTGITLNFAYAGEASTAKTMRILGLDFLANEDDVPVFVTDPNDPIIEAPIATGTTEGIKIGDWAIEDGNIAVTKDNNGKTVCSFTSTPTGKNRFKASVSNHDVSALPKLKVSYSCTKAFNLAVYYNGTSKSLQGYTNMDAGEATLTFDLTETVTELVLMVDRSGYEDATTYEDGTGKTVTLDFAFVDADGNAPSVDGGIAVNGTKTVDCPVYNWNKELADTVVATVTPFAGMGLEVKVGEQSVYETTFDGTAQQIIEANLSQFAEVEKVTFVLTGNGTMYFNDVILSKAAAVTMYATSNGEYFTTFEEIEGDGNYQWHMVRNASSGYPSVTATVSNWHEGYDVLAIDISVTSGVTLLGIKVGDTYMLDHWKASDFLQPGEHQFTYYRFHAGANWDGKTITIYANPASITGAGYTYESDFKIGMFFMKSSDLAEGSISFEEESYTFDYDGEIKSVTATDPNGASIKYQYAIEGKNYDAVSNAGTYTVTATSACTRTHLPATATTTLIINKVKAAVPQVTANVNGNTVSFTPVGGIEYKRDAEDEWEPLMTMTGLAYDTEYTLILRVADSDNVFASDETTLTFKTDKEKAATPSVTTTVDGKNVTFSATDGIEYKIGADGEWKDLATLTEFAYDTEYTLIIRTKATDTLLASDETTLTFKTEKDPADQGPGTDDSEKPGKEEKSGCGSVIGMSSAAILALGVAVTTLVAKRKED